MFLDIKRKDLFYFNILKVSREADTSICLSYCYNFQNIYHFA